MTELTGTVAARYALTTISPRLSGDGFTVSGTTLTRTIRLDPGASTTVKVQLGALTKELPDSATEYQRYRGYDPNTAWLTQMQEYNKFWVKNVPYLDIPDENVEKMSYSPAPGRTGSTRSTGTSPATTTSSPSTSKARSATTTKSR